MMRRNFSIFKQTPEQTWSTDKEGRKNFTESIARDANQELRNISHSFFNSCIDIAGTTVAGALFYLYQKYDEEHETVEQIKSLLNLNNSTFSLNEATDIGEVGDYSIATGLVVCATALAMLTATNYISDRYLFGDVDNADNVKRGISKMSEGHITEALNIIANNPENLDEIKTKKPSKLLELHKKEISYITAGIITDLSGLPTNQQYLLFSFTRCLTETLLNFANDHQKVKSQKLLPYGLTDQFSIQEDKEELTHALQSEIESKRDQNYYSDFTAKHLLFTARVMTFFIALHHELGPDVSSPLLEKSADFFMASCASNMIGVIGNALLEHSKLRDKDSADLDIEMGRVDDFSNEDKNTPNIKKSKSENDLPTATKPVFSRSLSENDLTNDR